MRGSYPTQHKKNAKIKHKTLGTQGARVFLRGVKSVSMGVTWKKKEKKNQRQKKNSDKQQNKVKPSLFSLKKKKRAIRERARMQYVSHFLNQCRPRYSRQPTLFFYTLGSGGEEGDIRGRVRIAVLG